MIGQLFVENPNLIEDLIEYLCLDQDPDELKEKIENIKNNKITRYERMITLVDRIEFINHLEIVSIHAQNFDYILENQEVMGINYDIGALRLYLSLTCVDIFSENKSVGEGFRQAFINSPSEIVAELEKNLLVISDENTDNDICTIAQYLYQIRNKYTHEGRRFHQISEIPITQFQNLNPRGIRGLIIRKNYDLIEGIIKVARERAKLVLDLD